MNLLLCSASCLALLSAGPALADSAAVDASSVDTLIITASRSGEPVEVKALGASVTVLDAEALTLRQTRIVSDILRDVPGLAVNRLGAIGSQTQVRVRGTEGNHVLVLIDGIEASDPYQGEYDFGTLIADEAARVEVLRGQQSSLYGSDAIGGVIQYITLSGAEAAGTRLRLEGGSFGTVSAAARTAGVSGDLDYALSASSYQTDGTKTARNGKRNIGSDSFGASAKLIWSPSETFRLTGVGRYSFTDADSNRSESNPASPLFGYIVDDPGAHYDNTALYGRVEAELTALDGRWVNAASVQVADTTRKAYTARGLDYGDKGKRYKGSVVSTYRFGTEAVRQRVTGAVDVERETFQNTTPASYVFQGRRHTDNVGIVGEYEAVVNQTLSLGFSVRRDQNNRFDDVTTWRAQGSYALAGGTRLRAAYGTGVKNPGYYELFGYSDGKYIGNPNLRPEQSKGWELGVEQTFAAEKATLGATWFDSVLKDEIYTTYPAPTYVATPGNRTTDSKQHGVELFANARPTDRLRIDAAYTWLHARENGVVEVRRPKSIASLSVTAFSSDARLSGTLSLRYNGKQTDVAYTDPSYRPVRVSLKAYTLANASLDYRLTPKVSVFGRVENLLDQDYEEVFSYATPGRAGYAGVRLAF